MQSFHEVTLIARSPRGTGRPHDACEKHLDTGSSGGVFARSLGTSRVNYIIYLSN